MVEPADMSLLDAWLDPAVRGALEARFWLPIAAQATLEVLVDDPSFAADPGRHPAMFADHGVVHARDVAAGLLPLVDGVVRPGGGYPPAPLPAWVPVGTTGAIRRAERNSAIVAEREVEVVMIPSETYVRAWLRPLRADELVARLRSRVQA